MKGFIVYPTYINNDDKTFVYLFGKLENGQSFLTINEILPHFFVKEKELKKISKYLKNYSTEKTNLKTFQNEIVFKIISKNQPELNKLFKEINKSVETYEADIKPHFRFMMDNNLLGSVNIEGEYEPSEKIDRIYKNPKIFSSDYSPKLRIASIDIEASPNLNKFFCIGIYSDNYRKVFMITDKKLDPYIISCKNELECLTKFKSELEKLDPDIITGWNIIDFDLKYLQKLFAENKISFDLGRSNQQCKLRIESGFFRASSAYIQGRQVLDGINLIKDPFIKEAPSIKQTNFKSYTLEDVSQAILKSGKLIRGNHRFTEIENLYKKHTQESLQKLADYNITDCKLVYDILKKTRMIELATERSQLTGLPLDRITSSIAAFDSLYIRQARKKGFVSPTTYFKKKPTKIKGGYVYSSKPGVHHNVLMLDFKSLYPSIIRTFNIDPASLVSKKSENIIQSPNSAYFKNQDGILPEIIKTLHKAREKAKKEKRELSNYAIKIIQNSFFGVLANPNCRYFDLKIANAITHFGQKIIKLTAKKIEKIGDYKIIYMDTDSVFVETNLSKSEAIGLGKKIQTRINKFYKSYVKKNYNRTSFLELEFEKLYLALMIPKIRAVKEDEIVAAKKRYAGLIEKNGNEQLQIVGLEAIRGDWTEAAKDFQRELLMKTFHKKPLKQFIKNYIRDILAGKLDSKLIYKKSIRKPLSEYVKITPPHVKAAKKLDKLESNLIEYYITTAGPEPKQKLQHKIDYKHYINRQIKPIANQILELLNTNFEDITQQTKQTKLF